MKTRTAFIAGMATQHMFLTLTGLAIKRIAEINQQAQNQKAIADFMAAMGGHGFDEPDDGEACGPTSSDIEEAFQGWDPNGAH